MSLAVLEKSTESACRLAIAVRDLAELSHQKAKQAIRTGKVTVDGRRILEPAKQLKAGQTVSLDWAAARPEKENRLSAKLVYRDGAVIVLDKPAGMLSTPTPEGEVNTALAAARRFCQGGKQALVVHRLDKETSGLMIFARGLKAARLFRAALDAHDVQRTYFCVVKGKPKPDSGVIGSILVRDAGSGRRGSRSGSLSVEPQGSSSQIPDTPHGRAAITHFETVAHTDGFSSLEVRLETGRTHQIRIHLAEIGCPILGERVYAKQPDAPRQALHSGRLGFVHPFSGQAHSFHSSWPADLVNVTPIGLNW
jgi:23S rRNA pseudouridine1911/1915/1917 synthase